VFPPKRRGIIVTFVNEPSSVCESPSDLSTEDSDLSADDLEMLKELEESIRASGMDGQGLCGQTPEGAIFCIKCRRCTHCKRCIICRWS
jgi:hypothetical protein